MRVLNFKANSQTPCRAHAVPLPRRAALIHTWNVTPLPFPDSAVSFVKLCVVAGNIRTASPTVQYWYASDNNLRATPSGSRKKTKAGRSPTCHLWTADANSHMPCPAYAALCCGLEKSLSERHGRGMGTARYMWISIYKTFVWNISHSKKTSEIYY
jgi:hypothetical protein